MAKLLIFFADDSCGILLLHDVQITDIRLNSFESKVKIYLDDGSFTLIHLIRTNCYKFSNSQN